MALFLAVLACSGELPPLPDLGTPSAPSGTSLAGATPSATSTPAFAMRVEAQDLTIRMGPGESYEVVSPLNGLPPYFQHREEIWLVRDGNPSCVADDSGNLWIHAGSDRGLVGWAAAFYDGRNLIYPIPPECGQ